MDRRSFVKFVAVAAAVLPVGAIRPRLHRDRSTAGGAGRRERFPAKRGGVWGLTPAAAESEGSLSRAGGIVGISIGAATGGGRFIADGGIVGIDWAE
ncbi:MAG TPA: twin-arginine translocation signal domain-containing protein [Longimicrobiales bacterium]